MKMKTELWQYFVTVLLALELAASASLAKETPQRVRQVAENNSEFAFDLYSLLKKEKGNLFFSPYSISAALAMTCGGARGNTATEMRKVMHFTLGEKEIHPAFAELNSELEEAQKRGAVQLLIANSLWPQKDHPFLPEYFSLTKDYYGVAITPLDYAKTESSRQVINKWVEDKTKDKIKNLIRQGDLDPLTRLVLVNAIYFKGNWDSQFKTNQTTEAEFFVSPHKTAQTPMMTQTHTFKYADIADLQMIELPYVGSDLSMLVILPKEKDALGKIEDRLTKENVDQWAKHLVEREVRIFLPKFKITWGTFELNAALQTLGMVDAFSDVNADFSGMDGQLHWLYIRHVLHKAFVDVNEEGTEAAAATAVVMRHGMPAPPPTFRADHPFVFLIKENQTGSILFMGRVTDLTKPGVQETQMEE
jgi:serpin B